jgi:methionyl-tRNA formyltransferase
VKGVALELGLPVYTPERPRTDDFLDAIAALEPDLSVVVAYGHILKPEVLMVPRLGSINVHASLLPELRGAAPINWAIARGHEQTGITIMRMVAAMDAGAVLHQVPEPMLPGVTASELTVRLSEVGAAALVEALAMLAAGAARETEQDHSAATYAPKIDRETARVDWRKPADEVALHVCAMDAVPGAWSMLDGAPIKLFGPSVVREAVEPADAPGPAGNGGPPPPEHPPAAGTVLRTDEASVTVATGSGSVALSQVQPPGRRRMSAADWIHGRGVEPGQRFE